MKFSHLPWVLAAGLCYSSTLEADAVAIYIPAFGSPAAHDLGLHASTILYLSIWRTLRKAPTPNPKGIFFGSGTAIWNEAPLGNESVADVGRENGAQLVLTGLAFPFGEGAIVTTRLHVLDLRNLDPNAETWTVHLDSNTNFSSQSELSFDLIPEREVSFPAIPLKKGDLEAFESPDLLSVHKAGADSPVIGHLGQGFTAKTQHRNLARVVTSDGVSGYVVLPDQGPEMEHVTLFSGAIIRMLRSDCVGALFLFNKLLSDETTPTRIAIDAKLMSAYCLEMTGNSGLQLTSEAMTQSPLASRVLRYRAMVALFEIQKAISAQPQIDVADLVNVYAEATNKASRVLDSDDPWLVQASAIAIQLAKRQKQLPRR